MWTFAAESSPDYKVIVAVVAIAALALQVALQVIKWRRDAAAPPTADNKMLEAAQSAAEAAQKALDAIQGVQAILLREHPATQQLRVYTPLGLEDDIRKIRDAVDDLHDLSGVHTDPGIGRKPR